MKVLNASDRSEIVSKLKEMLIEFKKKINIFELDLENRPKEWGRYQVEFNKEVNLIFRELMIFEEYCYRNNLKSDLDRLKKIFVNRMREPFEKGEYIKWVISKPYGYDGDFKYLEDIYQNEPVTDGYERLFDNYTMMSSISIAVRNRKNDFKKKILKVIKDNPGNDLTIMNLASGPAREIWEIKNDYNKKFKEINFDLYDIDGNALDFAKSRLKNCKNINFVMLNAIKLALTKNTTKFINKKYDLIYSTGLFDYFEDKVAQRLIVNLKNLLKKGGKLMVSDVRDKFSNPSFHLMEWIGDWPLVYRDDDRFRQLFINAGFEENNIDFDYEQQGIFQYITAKK